MIEAYSWSTPNGHKLHIMLEETGLESKLIPVHIGKGHQFQPEFLKVSPNGKIPAIVDTEGPDGEPLALAESAAILLYLGEKCDVLIPRSVRELNAMRQWLFFQMAHIGPMFGQAHHFTEYAPEKIPYAVQRYTRESRRLMGVLEKRLSRSSYLAGDEYSIADIATYPWIVSSAETIDPEEFLAVKRWKQAISDRPAVERGMAWLKDEGKLVMDDEARRHLFGSEGDPT